MTWSIDVTKICISPHVGGHCKYRPCEWPLWSSHAYHLPQPPGGTRRQLLCDLWAEVSGGSSSNSFIEETLFNAICIACLGCSPASTGQCYVTFKRFFEIATKYKMFVRSQTSRVAKQGPLNCFRFGYAFGVSRRGHSGLHLTERVQPNLNFAASAKKIRRLPESDQHVASMKTVYDGNLSDPTRDVTNNEQSSGWQSCFLFQTSRVLISSRNRLMPKNRPLPLPLVSSNQRSDSWFCSGVARQ